MIDKQKIIEILNNESVSENSSSNNRIIIEQDFENIADEIVKLFAIHNVVQQSEQFICHSCNTKHSGNNEDQLHEVCKECFSNI